MYIIANYVQECTAWVLHKLKKTILLLTLEQMNLRE